MAPAVMRLAFALLLAAEAANVVQNEVREHGALRRQKVRRTTCSCDCCSVTPRRPDEKVGLAGVKCAPADGHSSDICGQQCLASSNDRVLSLSAQNKLLDYQRFCFFECKPADGLASAPSTQCLALEDSDLSLVLDQNGNAKDPAVVYGRASPLVAFALSGRQTNGQPSDEVSPEVAQQAVDEGREQLNAASAGALEATERLRVDKQIFPPDDAVDPLDSVSDIRAMTKHTKDLALMAKEAAKRAVAALKEARVETWRTAMETANSELRRMKREDAAAGATKRNPPVTPWRVKAARAVTAASKDFRQEALAKQQVGRMKREEAAQAQNDAGQLRQKALGIREQAVVLQNQQKATEAEVALEKASDLESKAKQLAESADQMLADADTADADVAKSWDLANQAAKEAAEKEKMAVRVVTVSPDPLAGFVPAASPLP